MERLFPKYLRHLPPETPFCYMCLDGLVFLDSTAWLDELKAIFGATGAAHVSGPDQWTPSVLALRQGPRVILSFEGTKGSLGWLPFFANAGLKEYGPPPGQVFAPFATSATALEPLIKQAFLPGDVATFTGHSLGAAVASMLNSTFTRVGLNTLPAWCFGCPRYGDRAYFASARGSTLVVNLPQDPIPLLPPDVVGYIHRQPAALQWNQLLDSPPEKNFIFGWDRSAAPSKQLDYLVALAAANIVPQESPHQTYQYLRSCWAGLPAPIPGDVQLLFQLCTRLGLLDPWPSSAGRAQAEAWPASWPPALFGGALETPPGTVPFVSPLIPFKLED